MSFYDPGDSDGGFQIDLRATTETITRFHRTLMDRRAPVDWSTFDANRYEPRIVEVARDQWSQRAIAEYQSTAQFAQLLHRLTLIGAPIEMIGAATRLATDECRHAELCAQFADVLGGQTRRVERGLALFESEANLVVACVRTILHVCCFGETLSVPVLRALTLVATDPVAERVCEIIASDEEYHARFGWHSLGILLDELDPSDLARVADTLPSLMGRFERTCHGSPSVLERLIDTEFVVEEGEDNLGTLPSDGYAAIFYATIEQTILPALDAAGLEGTAAWARRVVPPDGRD